jgi:RNA polymerase sigma-70 factor (ECF subfamily)
MAGHSVRNLTRKTVDPLDPATRAVRVGDQHEFSELTEPYRHELQVHCYRILGSLPDAEDLVQETLLRAWLRIDTYQGRGSLRAWLYKIATNACLDALEKLSRRTLPYARGPHADPTQPLAQPVTEPDWLDPYPTEQIASMDLGPEARFSQHESITLAFLVALQGLSPRQRAVLILRDVLDWPVDEITDLLGTTVSAVYSLLHRARTTLTQNYQRGGFEVLNADDLSTRQLLDRYVQAWETADITGLTELLMEDVVLSMPPSPSWYRGRLAVTTLVGAMAFGGDAHGRWRLLPTVANACPAFAVYQYDEPSGVYQAFGLQVLSIKDSLVVDIVAYLTPSIVNAFGLPLQISK